MQRLLPFEKNNYFYSNRMGTACSQHLADGGLICGKPGGSERS
jgi:hypothetical protein